MEKWFWYQHLELIHPGGLSGWKLTLNTVYCAILRVREQKLMELEQKEILANKYLLDQGTPDSQKRP